MLSAGIIQDGSQSPKQQKGAVFARGRSCISSSFSVPKVLSLHKPEKKVGQSCRKKIETAKAAGDLCCGISLETLVPKWTCHLLIIAGSIDGTI